MEGCKTPCSSDSPYGCCDDNVTPAHGPFKEGCCLNTSFGCCPDNIAAATGPNFEGIEIVLFNFISEVSRH